MKIGVRKGMFAVSVLALILTACQKKEVEEVFQIEEPAVESSVSPIPENTNTTIAETEENTIDLENAETAKDAYQAFLSGNETVVTAERLKDEVMIYQDTEEEPKIFTKKAMSQITTPNDDQRDKYLKVEIEFDIPIATNYFIIAKLTKDTQENAKGIVIIPGLFQPTNLLVAKEQFNESITLESGRQTITLYFLAEKLKQRKMDGPYQVYVGIRYMDGENPIEESVMFLTKDYQYQQFE